MLKRIEFTQPRPMGRGFISSGFGLLLAVISLVWLSSSLAGPAGAAPPAQGPAGLTDLMDKARRDGLVLLLVGLDVPVKPEGEISPQQAKEQREAVRRAQDKLLADLAQSRLTVLARYKYIPFLAVAVDAAGLTALAQHPAVIALGENERLSPTLASSIPVIGANVAWGEGYTGAGQTVAILDTGVAKSHSFFTSGGSKVVSEACYSTTVPGLYQSLCPGGAAESTAVNSGLDCTTAAAGYPLAQGDCFHGTHVAGIAAGNNGGVDIGVAREAKIIAVQVFSLGIHPAACGGFPNCLPAFSADIIKGLERVYELRNTYNIAVVNMSLGSGEFAAACDNANGTTLATKAAVDLLRSAGIATIAASGNSGATAAMAQPACISSVISVGATNDFDVITSFSNIASFLDLLAPGVSISSAIPGGGVAQFNGTSMASPMAAGAWAVMKQKYGTTKTIPQILTLLRDTATTVNDSRSGGTVTGLRRINLDRALGIPPILFKKRAPFLVEAGQPLTYTLTVTNTDRFQVASQIFITDTVPVSTTLNAASLGGQASFSGIIPGSLITWKTNQNLAPGQSLKRTFAVTVEAGLADFVTLQNTAYLSPTQISTRSSALVSTTIGGTHVYMPVVLK